MTLKLRHTLSRADPGFLLLTSAGGFVSDVLGVLFARGPVALTPASRP